MTRNLKVLVLGLVAALALTAVVASSASAFTKFNWESGEPGTTAFKGTQAGTAEFVTNPGTISCSSGTIRGMVTGTSSETLATSESSATTGSEVGKHGLEYGGCTFLGFINVPVDNHNCQYRFRANGVVEIVNGGGSCVTEGISYEAGGCTVHVFPQTGLNGVTYVNTGSGTTGRTITVDVNPVSGVTYKAEGCVLGGNGTASNGVYRNPTGTNGASITIGCTTDTNAGMVARGCFMS